MENTHFTCIGRGHGAPAVPATREQWEQMRREPWLAEMCARIEQGDDELKHRLPVWTPHCAEFANNHRAAADALKPLNRLMIDFDEKGHTDEIVERLAAASPLPLLLIEESARRGTHVLVELPEGMDAETAQQLMQEATGYEPDRQVKGVDRCIYMVPEDHTKFVSDRLFLPSSWEERFPSLFPSSWEEGPGVEEKSSFTAINKEGTLSNQTTPSPFLRPSGSKRPFGSSASLFEEGKTFPTSFNSIPYSDIIAEYWRRTGGEPPIGKRNTRLHQLAANLRAICDNNEEWLLEVMPRFELKEQEMKSIIHSACKEPTKGSKLIDKILEDLKEEKEFISSTPGPSSQEEGKTPPAMPKKLPKIVQLLTSKTPDIYKPAVAHAIFPALGAHLWKVRFKYIDNVMHEATFMNVLMAGTGAGKDCISQPINHIMADIRRRDAENLKREADWKKEVNSKGSNKDKRQRPDGLVIQEVDPDMTNPAFVMRMAEADEHFLYTKMNEIDQFDALRGSANGSQQFQIMCLAFDPDNRYGQTRVGTQSVTEKVCIRFNWNAATTIQKGQRYFRNVLTDGPISRINFCTIPEREIGADMPVYGTYDSNFDEELRPYIDRLCRAAGVIDCPQAFRLAKKLKDECAEFARLSQSRVYENLSFRANVIAYLKACVLYICNDYRWSKEIEDFVRWSLQYDLYCKMAFFGEAIENVNRNADEHATRRGPRNLLNLLPDEFTTHDADLIRQANGMDTRGTRNMLSQWVHRGYLLQMTDDSFRKLKK